MKQGGIQYESGEPLSYIHYPVFDKLGEEGKTVAVLSGTVYWKSYLQGILPGSVKGIICVVRNSLGQEFTYRINGSEAEFLGLEDVHDSRLDDMELKVVYSDFVYADRAGYGRYTGVPVNSERISYTIQLYPSKDMEDDYRTNKVSWKRRETGPAVRFHISCSPYLLIIKPTIYACAILFIFIFTTVIFLLYDRYVDRRQKVVSLAAAKSDAVVSSLFPEAVRDRIMNDDNKSVEKSLFDKNPASKSSLENVPKDFIADFFPEATVMFGDLVGFTAWSSKRVGLSVRLEVKKKEKVSRLPNFLILLHLAYLFKQEPTKVFELLETLYNSFDAIAK